MSSDMSTRRIMVRSEKVLSGLIAKVDAAARHFKCIVIQSWYQRFSVVATAAPPPANLREQSPGRRAVGPGAILGRTRGGPMDHSHIRGGRIRREVQLMGL